MKTILAGSLLVLAAIALLIANFLPFTAEADLLGKRPDLSGRITMWQSLKQYPHIKELYHQEFPNGRKYRWSVLWAVIALCALVAGILILVKV